MNTCTIIINGKTFAHQGGSVIGIINGNVMIGDETIYVADQKVVNIQIHGNVERLKVNACHQVAITGDAGDVQTQSGDVMCGNVSGDVRTTSGDIECGVVTGSVSTTSGDVHCGKVGGNVKTGSGDITGVRS
jgi:hypothetical protein